MTRVLVTGGAGYIGSHTVEKLLEQNFEVFVYDNFSTGHSKLVPEGVKIIQGDIRDDASVARVLKDLGIQSIVHFAALISVEESLRNPAQYYSNNFYGTLSLLKAIEKSPIQNFIFSSTAAVYADPHGNAVHEKSALNPVTPYGASKLLSERALADFSRVSGLKTMILRYFNVAGASLSNVRGQIGDHHTALIKRAALAAVGKVPEMKIFGTDYPSVDGTAVRDFIHVEDLADIHVISLQKLLSGGESNLFNCGYGSGFTVRQVIETMKKVSGVDFPVREEGRRAGDLGAVIADNSKLAKTLGWKPRYNDLEMICRTAYAWEKKVLESGNAQ